LQNAELEKQSAVSLRNRSTQPATLRLYEIGENGPLETCLANPKMLYNRQRFGCGGVASKISKTRT
jgi:hypothetical protein